MKTFHCSNCRSLVFFENTKCLKCGHSLAYLPNLAEMAALKRNSAGLWQVEGSGFSKQVYRLCANYEARNICNWAMPHDDPETLCRSCRLTRVIPDLTPTGMLAWSRLESAKRRLIHSLLVLNLPLVKKDVDTPTGVAFEFLKDSTEPNGDRQRVLTGHDNGLITINIAEADDVQRERQRQQHGEPYRTLLGHFRHEIGHYYWDRLIQGSSRLDAFRHLFGDERADYAEALKKHYENGPPENWQRKYISAYSSSHPWEDWAETWAHFLHMSDALETAGAAGLSLQPSSARDPALPALSPSTPIMQQGFDKMIERWLSLTYVLNNLSRGLGLQDSYPFLLSTPVIQKLRFIYDTVKPMVVFGQQRHGPPKSKARTAAGGATSVLIAVAASAALAGVAHLLWYTATSGGRGRSRR